MCGIAGVVTRGERREALAAAVDRMTRSLHHRGPDDHQVWVDRRGVVALGQARLAIVDLSPTGRQPMTSASGRFTITFNGEIYDHRDARRELEAAGVRFRGRSDTEVLLEAVERWGVESTLARIDGMFAFALWDEQAESLVLARDRLGEKPLYYAHAGGAVLFGSELKALRRHPSCPTELDLGALSLYLRFGYVPAPWTIYEGVRKVPPASLIRFSPGVSNQEPQKWWDLTDLVTADRQEGLGDEEAIDELARLLETSTARRLAADVPVGAFLSGGIDSTAVCAAAAAVSPTPVRTFTVGFEGAAFDESVGAAAIATTLGTDHTSVLLTPADALAIVPMLPDMYDEPFGDSSQIATHLVSAVARRSVTVALSGDGGDELFAGYTRSVALDRIWRRVAGVPSPVRRTVSRLAARVGSARWDALGDLRRTPRLLRQSRLSAKVEKSLRMLEARDVADAYLRTVTLTDDSDTYLQHASRRGSLLLEPARWPKLADLTELSLYLDTITYLPDDILVKVDRAAMAVGLETRLPLLSDDIVRFAWSLPLDLKVRGTHQKWVLRRLAARHVPGGLLDRPKMGFGVPVRDWLRADLRSWASDLLGSGRLAEEGILDADRVRRTWEAHQRGEDHTHVLWAILMFEAWQERWRSARTEAA